MHESRINDISILAKLGCFLIRFYQKHISCYLNNCCRYNPSCSQYTLEAICKYGFFMGCIKGFFRIIRCNPFAKGGDDFLK